MKRLTILSLAIAACQMLCAQQEGVTLSGSLQSDILLPETDRAIGAEKTGDLLTNTYADLQLQSRYVDAGARLEYLEHPLPGFERDFEGWGVPHFWVKGKLKGAELTAGTFYEQFGSGLILRTYEERSLGIDNSLLGARLTVQPAEGITLKVLSGKQRRYWRWDGALVSGADAEVSIDRWLPALRASDTHLTVGASWVNKHEEDEDIFTDPTHRLNLPRFVNAWDLRASLNSGPWGLLAEYAQKTQDPSFDNGYSYRQGTAFLFSGSYAKRGLSVLLQAKRSENMAFRSRRSALGTAAFINHLPAFTQDHTYTLAALYPYATQLATGEWAYQAEVGYNFKRNSTLGGKYGMNAKLNFSLVHDLDATTDYYRDIDVQLTRRLSRDFKLTLMYMNQLYNKTVVEGEGGMVHANIFIADGMLQLSRKTRLRTELQYLTTPDDQGDWAFALAELSLVPHWMFTVSDNWNCGETDTHYYQASVTYNHDAHRLQLGYGRTRAGYNCSGGVCRYVPSQRGVTLSYNYNF